MSVEFRDLTVTQIRETITRLQSPVSELSELLPLLTAPLDAIGLLPPVYQQYNTRSFPPDVTIQLPKLISPIQTALLDNIIPAWLLTFREQKLEGLLHQYFCPDSFFSATQNAGDIALSAYSNLLSSPFHDFTVDALCRLGTRYPLDRLHSAIFSASSSIPSHKKTNVWEDLVRSVISVPTKIANHYGTKDIPLEVQAHTYYSGICTRLEVLVASFPDAIDAETITSSSFLVSKMINIGLFPSVLPLAPSQASFFSTIMPTIRTRLATLPSGQQETYANIWIELWASLPSHLFSKALASLFAHLADLHDVLDASVESRGLMKREGRLLVRMFGVLEDAEDEKWQAVSAVLLMRTWSISRARILVCWATISEENVIPPRTLETLLSNVMEIWSSPDHIKLSLLSHHQYITTLLLLTVSSFLPSSPSLQSLAFSPAFIGAISTYIGHLDPAVRRCGMLAAEAVAWRTGSKLDFAQWSGEGQGREWARSVRALCEGRDTEAEEAAPDVIRLEAADAGEKAVVEEPADEVRTDSQKPKKPTVIRVADAGSDSDDSLTGYASSPSSSRAPSPTPSELDELEKDPTLGVGRKKVQKPVYLADLGSMLRGGAKPDDVEAADRVEVALGCAEELIRRKRGFGLELEENTVNLVYALVGLQNNFELEGFDEKRQGAVTALVACCPKRAAPAIIDEYFKNQYSTAQRFVMLNALALGARELAALPVPPSAVPANRLAFPSKQLPAALHKKYITIGDTGEGAQIHRMLDEISRVAIASGKDAAEEKVPQLVRERQLRIKKPGRVTEVNSSTSSAPTTTLANTHKGPTTFTEVAAEYFVGPLIGKFWLFLRDEQVREERTAHRTHAYRGTGTGLLLSPLVLAQFLGTSAVLLHAARHAPAFLAVLAPDALELALTLGTRPMSSSGEDKEMEAAVLTAGLELALVALDGCLELDGGRSLGLDHTSLLLGTGEWAGQVLNALEGGARVQGGGGAQELRLRRSAAGVVLKVEELTSKWRQSMVSI